MLSNVVNTGMQTKITHLKDNFNSLEGKSFFKRLQQIITLNFLIVYHVAL